MTNFTRYQNRELGWTDSHHLPTRLGLSSRAEDDYEDTDEEEEGRLTGDEAEDEDEDDDEEEKRKGMVSGNQRFDSKTLLESATAPAIHKRIV